MKLRYLAMGLVLLSGCKSAHQIRPPPKPPLPPGLKPAPASATSSNHQIRRMVTYTPTDFAVTDLKFIHKTNLVLTWINGIPPFQPQVKLDVASDWTDYGPSTTQRSITNRAPVSTRAFFRVRSLATPGQLQWIAQATGSCQGNNCAVDSGNAIVVGSFNGTVNFGNGTANLTTSNPADADGFMVKYDQSGRALWSKRIGTTGPDSLSGVAIDSKGNIIVTGHFAPGSDFNIFVAKYDGANPPNLIWEKHFGGTDLDRGRAVTVDANNNVIICATLGSLNADFGGVTLSTAGLDDVVIAKLTPNGSTVWAKRYGGTANDRPTGLAVAGTGDVWVAGSFFGTTDLGSGPVSVAPAVQKAFLARYSGADGTYRNGSLRTIGNSGNNSANDVAIGQNGNVIITGGCKDAVDFGGGPVLIGGTIATGNAVFVAAYDSTGNYLWAKELGGSSCCTVTGNSVAVDGISIAITGQSNDHMITGTEFLIGNGYYVVAFSDAGDYQWGRIASGGGASVGTGVAFDSFGHIVTAGSAASPVNFGPGPNGQNILSTAPIGVSAAFAGKYTK